MEGFIAVRYLLADLLQSAWFDQNEGDYYIFFDFPFLFSTLTIDIMSSSFEDIKWFSYKNTSKDMTILDDLGIDLMKYKSKEVCSFINNKYACGQLLRISNARRITSSSTTLVDKF